jgi:hypothetical protein
MAAGCDLTDDTREEIDQAAWAAKAPGITVLPAVYPGTGVVTPSGERFTVKQHIGSDVSFNLTNTEYAFIGWRAYPGDVRSRFDWSTLTARNEAGEELTPYTAHEALIESDPERPTSARLTARLSGGEIMLVPVVAPRPRVGFQPDGGSSTPAIVNSPIVLQLSAKVNPA